MGDVIQLRDYNPKIKEAPTPNAVTIAALEDCEAGKLYSAGTNVDLLYGVDLIAAYHAVYPKSIDPWPGMDSANYVTPEKDPA